MKTYEFEIKFSGGEAIKINCSSERNAIIIACGERCKAEKNIIMDRIICKELNLNHAPALNVTYRLN